MKALIVTALLALPAAAFTHVALAQYPNQPVRIVTNAPPGTAPDVLARTFAARLTQDSGHQAIVENRVAANGYPAAEYVSKSTPNGYTLFVGADAIFAINPHVYGGSFDPNRALAPVATLVAQELVLAAPPSLGARTLPQFIDIAKKAPKPLAYGSAGNGTQAHLAMEMLKSATGIELLHIPYKGGAPATTALLAGEVAAYFGGTAMKPHVASGKVVALGVSSAKPSPAMPDVPPVAQTVPGFDITLWIGLFAPAGVPDDTMRGVRARVAQFLAAPDTAQKFDAAGMRPFPTTPDELSALIKRDFERYGAIAKRLNLKID